MVSADPPDLAHRRTADPTASVTKRGLLLVSRSIEAMLAEVAGDGRPLVVALFEDARYFEVERDRYAAMAARMDVVVGFCGGDGSPLPDGLVHLPLPREHPLALEWTVLALGPSIAAGLVAVDLGVVDGGRRLEGGRRFTSRQGTDPDWVRSELARVVGAASELLPHDTGAWLLRRLWEVGDPLGSDAAARARTERAGLERAWEALIETTQDLEIAQLHADLDPLTGAFNRRHLEHYLSRVGPRAPGLAGALFDLDDFKGLNDRFGHAIGDRALQRFAEVLRAHVRSSDPVFRLGGDEWLVLMPGLPRTPMLTRIQDTLVALREVAIDEAAGIVGLRASVGVGVFPGGRLDLDQLDAAMYRAKRSGGGIATIEQVAATAAT